MLGRGRTRDASGDADDHELTDLEITDDPDYATMYPPHCLRGTPGAAKIPETVQRDPFPVSLTPYPPGLVPELCAAAGSCSS